MALRIYGNTGGETELLVGPLTFPLTGDTYNITLTEQQEALLNSESTTIAVGGLSRTYRAVETQGPASVSLVVQPINGSEHTLQWTTVPLPSGTTRRNYDVYVNGVDQGLSKVHPVNSWELTGLPTDAATMQITLYYFDTFTNGSTGDLITADTKTFTQTQVDAGTAPDPTGLSEITIPATNYGYGSFPSSGWPGMWDSVSATNRFGGGDGSCRTMTFEGKRSLQTSHEAFPNYTTGQRVTRGARMDAGGVTEARLSQLIYHPVGHDFGPQPGSGSTMGQATKCGLGLMTEVDASGGNNSTQGSSMRFITRRVTSNAQPHYGLYLYHFDQTQAYGDDIDTGVDVIEGEWVELRADARLNTGYGVHDGRVRMWINGDLVIERNNICFIGQQPTYSGAPSVPQYNTWLFSSFYGGGTTPNWSPITTQYVNFAEIKVGSGLF